MTRRYDRAGYVQTIARLRAARPGIALTTDLIVGFPTETDADFAETLSLMDEVRFTDSFSFKYSERPGTPAARRGLGELAPELSQARLEQVQARQRELTLAAHAARLGERVEVLVDGQPGQERRQRSGRDPQNRLVNFRAAAELRAGSYALVDVDGYTPHSLLGAQTALPG